MLRLARRFLHPNAERRRLMTGVLGAFLLAVLSFSSVFASVEADHDCHGNDCPVCQEIQVCLEACQLIGSAAPAKAAAAPVAVYMTETPVPHAESACAITLLSLDVRFDE